MRMPGWPDANAAAQAVATTAVPGGPAVSTAHHERTLLKDEHETHLPTEQQASQTDARLPRADEYARRARGPQAPAGEGPQAPDRFDSSQAAELSSPRRGHPQRFPKAFRLRKRHQFLALQREGRRQTLPHFIVISRHREHPPSRLGITTSRKVGGAPARNHVRRLVREFFRHRRADLVPPRDVLVIARPAAATVSYADVVHELARALHLGPIAE
jgi:ribonuclease P protein component